MNRLSGRSAACVFIGLGCLLVLRGYAQFQPLLPIGSPPALSCSPVPCVLPNVQISSGPAPVNTNPIAANPRNSSQLLSGGNDSNCASLQGFYASSDGGSTWVRNCLTSLPNQTGNGNPILGYDLHQVAYAGGTDVNPTGGAVVVIAKSRNNGVTWSAVKQAVPAILGGLADRPWVEIDTGSSSPHANTLYISATQFDASGNSEISVSHSSDGGGTWSSVLVDAKQLFPAVDHFSDLAIGKDGTVYVSWMRCTANGPTGDCGGTQAKMMFSKSTDGGNTWSAPSMSAVANLTPDNCSCAFYGNLPNTSEPVSDIPVVAVDNSTGPHAGTLYVSPYNWTGQFMQVTVVHSSDGGTTWSAPVPVAPPTATKDQFQSWVSVSGSGRVAVTWLDRRNDSQNLRYQPFIALSSNGGTSFSGNLALSTFLSDPSSVGNFRTHVWSAKSVYAVWPDTRTGVSQDELGGIQF
jgi:hypothetical protein